MNTVSTKKIHSSNKKNVVIVGSGFAGLNAAKGLSNYPDVQVLLIDQRNHHLFQPLLYQVATAGLNPSDIAVPIRAQFSDAINVNVQMSKVESIDLEKKLITSHSLHETNQTIKIQFDYLVLACGAKHSYFAHPEWEDLAPGLKTLEHATEIRKRILSIYELAESEPNEEIRKDLLSFVVVGGGPTGVELAGAIADISRTVLINDFKNIDPTQTKVTLIEAGPRILSQFSEGLSQAAVKDLNSLGVDVMLSTLVIDITKDGVHTTDTFIASRCVIWAAGVQAAKILFEQEVEKDKAGRIKVTSDLSIPGYPDVFVAGDLACIQMDNNTIVPGLAPAAIQAGRYVAKKILASIHNVPMKNFKYFDKGQMATIGKNKAIMQLGKFTMTGFFAWIAWFFIHIIYLVGFKNRISVISIWAWSYLFSKRGSRLITDNKQQF